MDTKTFIDDYMGCRSNKRRSSDSVYFELHWERDLKRLEKDFADRSLVPFLYAFVAPKPRPREVIACLMQGKILQYHFDRKIRPIVESELTESTFNNRVGYGPDKCLEKVLRDIKTVSKNYTRDCYIITRDIQSYFPSTNLDHSYDRYRKLIEKYFQESEEMDDLLYILMRTNYSYPQTNARLRCSKERWRPVIDSGKSVIFNCPEDRGACLGNQYWQVEKNYDLNDFDHWQVDVCGMYYTRFVDDMIWIVPNKTMGLAHVAQSEKILKEQFGYSMHPRKRYCQHYSKGGQFISAWFRMGRLYIGNRVVHNAEFTVKKWNKHVKLDNLEHFLCSINSYLGLMKHRNAYGIIRNLVDKVAPGWLHFCSYNDDRRCFQANPGYTHNELLIKKYHIKLHKYHGHIRSDQRFGISAA